MADKVFKTIGASNHISDGYQDRQEEDFYATPDIAVEKLFEICGKHNIRLPNLIMEPSVGSGNIAEVLKKHGHQVTGFDIVDRRWPGTIVKDFLTVDERPEEPMAIVANYPYKYVAEHTFHSLQLLRNGEYLCSLAKIQFLETEKRRKLFDEYPPKFCFVFSKRIGCLNNGLSPKNSSAVCYAWFIWEKGFDGYPLIDWI